MAEPKQDGGAAFPGHANRPASMAPGMSVRKYFAGQALAGLLADPEWTDIEHMSELAYKFADAMIEADDA